MDVQTPDQMPAEFWELLYNHKQICEALVHEGCVVSKAHFQHRFIQLTALNKSPLPKETTAILLTSLNRSLYHYFSFQYGLSFTQCCYQKRLLTHGAVDADGVLSAADQIIDSFAAHLDKNRTEHRHLDKARTYIREHLSSNLSLAKVSAEVFISKSHLCYIFKTLTGMTYCDYVRQQRIQHARLLLATTNKAIDDIALACGFHSSTYFATVFRQSVGMPPSAFRGKCGNAASADNQDSLG